MVCQHCGAALSADARFCPQCGRPVVLVPSRRVSIPEDLAKRAEDFAGRLWVLEKVIDWLDTGQERFFLLTGEPGCGKTTLAAWLAGAGSPPGEAEAARSLDRVRGAWHAAHFCLAEERRGTVDPARFAQSLARQLTDQLDDYAVAACKRLAPEINITQEVRENWGQMVGAQIEMIIHENAEGIYRRVVREPLEALYQRRPDLRLFILVDALDEALTHDSPNIVTLLAGSGDLPPGVRFLLTSRNEDRVIDQFKQKRRVNLSIDEYKHSADSDIRTYIKQRLAAAPLKELAATAEQDVIDRLVARADGNFLYVKFFLDEVAGKKRSLAGLEGLPRGLYGLYRTFLDRLDPESRQMGPRRKWSDHYQPLLGCLSVAVPSAPLSLLSGWTGIDRGRVPALLHDLIQVIEYDPREGNGYRLFHRSLADFLASETYEEEGAPKLNFYYTPPEDQHRRIVAYYRGNSRTWLELNWRGIDDYGLRNLVGHLYALREDQAHRMELHNLIHAEPFRQERFKRGSHPGAFLGDLRLALELSLEDDDLARTWEHIRLNRVIVREEQDFSRIVLAVQNGAFEEALERTSLYAGLPHSQALARLWIAWEATAKGKKDEATTAARQALLHVRCRLPEKKENLPRDNGDPVWLGLNGDQQHAVAREEANELLLKKANATQEALERLLIRIARAVSQDTSEQGSWLRDITESWPKGQVTAIIGRLTEDLNSWGNLFDAQMLNRSIQDLLNDLREQRRSSEEPTKVREATFSYQRKLAAGLFNSRQEPYWPVQEVVELISLDDYPSYRELALAWIAAAVLSHEDDREARRALSLVLYRMFSFSSIGFWGDSIAATLIGRAGEMNSEANTDEWIDRLKGIHIDSTIEIKFEEKEELREEAGLPMDPWSHEMRRHSAIAAVLHRQGKREKVAQAESLLQKAQNPDRKQSYAGFRALARLSLACRWLEWKQPVPAGKQVDAAWSDANHMLDVVLRKEILDLIDQMKKWMKELNENRAQLDYTEALKRAPILTGMERNLYMEFLSAVTYPRVDLLKKLLPLTLDDATTTDAVLGRLLGVVAAERLPEEPFAKLVTAMGLDWWASYLIHQTKE